SKAIELNPNYADAYYNRGESKISLKDYKEAINDFNKVIELDPLSADAYYNRGISKYYTNDLNGACEDAKKSRSLGFDASELIQISCNY
ncbi:tetratricopeptide repeat protein, partial [Flavobacteriaceae bacterium]|nr:tetratricopeptide repeat protein [Flavobacteriaceae bacterium]